MFAVKNKDGTLFQGYDSGILYWGDTDYRIYDEAMAREVVEFINTLSGDSQCYSFPC